MGMPVALCMCVNEEWHCIRLLHDIWHRDGRSTPDRIGESIERLSRLIDTDSESLTLSQVLTLALVLFCGMSLHHNVT